MEQFTEQIKAPEQAETKPGNVIDMKEALDRRPQAVPQDTKAEIARLREELARAETWAGETGDPRDREIIKEKETQLAKLAGPAQPSEPKPAIGHGLGARLANILKLKKAA
jgi:hypothetical protein